MQSILVINQENPYHMSNTVKFNIPFLVGGEVYSDYIFLSMSNWSIFPSLVLLPVNPEFYPLLSK